MFRTRPVADRWVWRWIRRTGGWWGLVSPSALELIGRRLSVRRFANLVGGLLVLTAVVIPIVSRRIGGGDQSLKAQVAALVIVAVAPAIREVVLIIGDGWLARQLVSRVSESQRHRAGALLGTWRTVNVLFVYAFAVCIAVALFVRGGDQRLATTFAGLVVLYGVIGLLTLRHVLHRPAVAVDADSLVMDRRLRAADVYFVIYPMLVLPSAITPLAATLGDRGVVLSDWLYLPIGAVVVAAGGIESLAKLGPKGERELSIRTAQS